MNRRSTSSDALDEYIRRGSRKVHGWFARVDAEIFRAILEHQNASGLEGGIAEIGLHHGKSFVALCLALRTGQRAYGIDLFERQSLNTDQSGHGERALLEANLAAAAVPASAVVLDGRPSMSVTPADIRQAAGKIRFFSIDGGHHFDAVRSDLELAERTLAPHGVVALDDFLRPEWPDVSAAYFWWFERKTTPLAPFAIGFNKLYLAWPDYIARYQTALCDARFLTPFLSKRYVFGGNDIPVYQRFPQLEWGPKERLAEHLKVFHPGLYVSVRNMLHSISSRRGASDSRRRAPTKSSRTALR